MQKTTLGVEFGSTRIKAVLIGEDGAPLASGGFEWENRLENGLWTYGLDEVWTGMQTAYRNLCNDFGGVVQPDAIGVSAMMHGYLPFDAAGEQLAAFRTWRCTNTERAAAALTKEFDFNIPLRWSIAHLYQAVLDGEEHLHNLDFLTTLAGYVHWKLTGERVIGVGDASGMFPIDEAGAYDTQRMNVFDTLMGDKYGWTLDGVLPRPLTAGDAAGCLTAEGAALIDPSGQLKPGVPLCPPEGDAGTGMTATCSVSPRTGNVSAGTSIFAMVVLEKGLSKLYPEIDIATTPDGRPVAMVHGNNCSADIDAWVKVFGEFSTAFGMNIDKPQMYDTLYNLALGGDADCGGLLGYNYLSGEPVTGLDEGRPLFVRTPDASFNLANFVRSLLLSAVAPLKVGMDILGGESVALDSMTGHGGFFKTEKVGQTVMAAALNVPITVMSSAGEGGAWGIALLALYMLQKMDGETLDTYLKDRIFAGADGVTIAPNAADVAGFERYMKRYMDGLAIERSAVDNMR